LKIVNSKKYIYCKNIDCDIFNIGIDYIIKLAVFMSRTNTLENKNIHTCIKSSDVIRYNIM